MADYTFPVIELVMPNNITELDAFDYKIDLSLDFSADKASFTLSNANGESLYKYKKFDQFEIWAGYNKADTRIFKGMITSIVPSMNNGNTVRYEGQNMAALIMFYNAKKTPMFGMSDRGVRDLIENLFKANSVPFNGEITQWAGTEEITTQYPGATLLTSKIGEIPLHLRIKQESNDTIGAMLQKIKEKIAYEMWIDSDGAIRVEPLSILQVQGNSTGITLTYGENIKTMEVGDLGQIYNRVEVYGLHPDTNYAYAEDKILIAQMGGDPIGVRTFVVRDRSLGNYKTCQKVAQEKLLQLVKSFKITATTIFLPTIKQGDSVTLDNVFMGVNGTFIVQSVSHSIAGSNAETTLELFGGIVSRVPEKLVKTKILSIATAERR